MFINPQADQLSVLPVVFLSKESNTRSIPRAASGRVRHLTLSTLPVRH